MAFSRSLPCLTVLYLSLTLVLPRAHGHVDASLPSLPDHHGPNHDHDHHPGELCGWLPRTLAPPQLLSWRQRRAAPSCPLAIDDSVGPQPQAWLPWTHRPFCANTSYCVYTESTFGDGGRYGMIPRGGGRGGTAGKRGISIIATPEAAAGDLADLFVEAYFVSAARGEHVAPAASSPSPPDSAAPHSPTPAPPPPRPYELRRIPGAGLGLVASRRIRRGTVIMVDAAAVLADVTFPGRVRRADGNRLLARAVGQLPDPQRVLGLATSSPEDEKGGREAPLVEDVLRTNTFSARVGGGDYMALFADIARMNHACKPTAFTRFSEKTLTMTAVAFRDIEPGEEITISYSEFGMTYAERQGALLQRWGFSCGCALCSAPVSERASSDRRRQEIRRIRGEVVGLVRRREYREAVALNEDMLRLVAEEGLVPHLGEHHDMVARLLHAAGDLDAAKRYAEMALAELESFGGEEVYESVGDVRDLLQAIEQRLSTK